MGLRGLIWGLTDEWTDIRMSGNSPLCPTGHRPFGAAAKKGRKKEGMEGRKAARKEGRKEGRKKERREGRKGKNGETGGRKQGR